MADRVREIEMDAVEMNRRNDMDTVEVWMDRQEEIDGDTVLRTATDRNTTQLQIPTHCTADKLSPPGNSTGQDDRSQSKTVVPRCNTRGCTKTLLMRASSLN